MRKEKFCFRPRWRESFYPSAETTTTKRQNMWLSGIIGQCFLRERKKGDCPSLLPEERSQFVAQGGNIQRKSRDLPQLRRSNWEWRDQSYYTPQKRLLVREKALESYRVPRSHEQSINQHRCVWNLPEAMEGATQKE